jgi:hypothetical protein
MPLLSLTQTQLICKDSLLDLTTFKKLSNLLQIGTFAKKFSLIKIGNIVLPEFPLLLAPMEDVSDPPFRRLCKMHGADLMYSEFISSEGLIRDAIKSRMK